ncbi:MAG: hypothetical protein OXF20_11040, partial [Gammaproteobacteria bacterium]|nr:hypothetical protein [Gammaproteobacteria bacterium]
APLQHPLHGLEEADSFLSTYVYKSLNLRGGGGGNVINLRNNLHFRHGFAWSWQGKMVELAKKYLKTPQKSSDTPLVRD